MLLLGPEHLESRFVRAYSLHALDALICMAHRAPLMARQLLQVRIRSRLWRAVLSVAVARGHHIAYLFHQGVLALNILMGALVGLVLLRWNPRLSLLARALLHELAILLIPRRLLLLILLIRQINIRRRSASQNLICRCRLFFALV